MTKDELEQKIADLEAENKTLLEENARLQAELEKTSQEVDKVLPTITIDKQKYKVRSRAFTYQGKRVTFEDLKNDKDLQRALVEKQSGILQKI